MNNISILKKIFPEPPSKNYTGLDYDDEGLYSITHPKEADIISLSIIDILGTTNIHIIDLTAGCGGNMISFIKYFIKATGIEINIDRCNILKQNLSKYSINNYELICCSATDNNYINYDNYDVFFIDPPWGGPDYKKYVDIELYLSDIKLNEFVLMLPKNKLIVLKLPFNYNIDKFNNNIIKKIYINNIIILFIMY
jgi:16S rRNA G966 N2-methylase RsmD